jgi:hypothetical protein
VPLSKIILSSSELGLKWTATLLYHDHEGTLLGAATRLVSTAAMHPAKRAANLFRRANG